MSGKQFGRAHGASIDQWDNEEQDPVVKRTKMSSSQHGPAPEKSLLACTALRIICQKWMVDWRLSWDPYMYSERQQILKEELLSNHLSFLQKQQQEHTFNPVEAREAFLQKLDITYDICDMEQAKHLGRALATQLQLRNIPQLLPTAAQLAAIAEPVSTVIKHDTFSLSMLTVVLVGSEKCRYK